MSITPGETVLTALLGLAATAPGFTPDLTPTAVEQAASSPLEIEHPKWAHRPTLNEILLAYPVVAYRAHRNGQVSLQCTARTDGAMKTCRILAEDPKHYNFGWAALAVAFKFKLEPKLEDGSSVEGRTTTIRITFKTDPVG